MLSSIHSSVKAKVHSPALWVSFSLFISESITKVFFFFLSFCWSCIHIILIRTVFWGTIIFKLKGGIPTYPTHLGNVQNWHLLNTYYVSDTTCTSFLCEFSPAPHIAVSNKIVLFFLYLQVGVVNTVWIAFILNIYYTLILRQLVVVYLKSKFNWASCTQSGNLKASAAPTAHLCQHWRHFYFQWLIFSIRVYCPFVSRCVAMCVCECACRENKRNKA